MVRQALFLLLAFLSGLSIGGYAMGNKTVTSTTPDLTPGVKQESITNVIANTNHLGDPVEETAATAVTASDITDSPDRLAESNDQETPGFAFEAMDEAAQLQVLGTRWAELDKQVKRLDKLVYRLNRELARIKMDPDKPGVEDTENGKMPVATPEERYDALVAVGVATSDAEEILWRQSELDLERLELQDLALREGWYRTSRYFDALRELNADAVDLRGEIGDEAFDRYLYGTGEANRVKVNSVIQGSAAEVSGLLPGDVIEYYGDRPILNFSDLRSASSEGVRNESVPLLIKRGNRYIEAFILRGPLGVRLEAISSPPSS